MKLLNYHFPLYLFTFTMTLFSLSSCSSDDDMKNNVEGAFTITNISSGKVMNASSNKMFDKDTLRIMFQPKEEHKDLQFTIDCEELKSIGDNLYILKSNTLSPNSLRIIHDEDLRTPIYDTSYVLPTSNSGYSSRL